MLPSAVVPSLSRTVAPGSDMPVSVIVVAEEMPSRAEMPVSLAAVSTGAVGASGAWESIVTISGAEARLTELPGAVAVTVIRCTPSSSVAAAVKLVAVPLAVCGGFVNVIVGMIEYRPVEPAVPVPMSEPSVS